MRKKIKKRFKEVTWIQASDSKILVMVMVHLHSSVLQNISVYLCMFTVFILLFSFSAVLKNKNKQMTHIIFEMLETALIILNF